MTSCLAQALRGDDNIITLLVLKKTKWIRGKTKDAPISVCSWNTVQVVLLLFAESTTTTRAPPLESRKQNGTKHRTASPVISLIRYEAGGVGGIGEGIPLDTNEHQWQAARRSFTDKRWIVADMKRAGNHK